MAQAQDRQITNAVPKKLPSPYHTSEFPRGLITDYIKLVDQLTVKAQKA